MHVNPQWLNNPISLFVVADRPQHKICTTWKAQRRCGNMIQ